jgi:hypothetical protein
MSELSEWGVQESVRCFVVDSEWCSVLDRNAFEGLNGNIELYGDGKALFRRAKISSEHNVR